MLLKSADNKESQITILKNLLNHEKVPADKKQQIEKELSNLGVGVATEKQAAYEIDFYFGPSKNVIVIHDLRLEVNGRVAQIDHLLMNRAFEVFVLETKTFNSGLSINESGEFSTSYDGREIGIPSPIAQNTRHVTVLKDAFKQIGRPKRLGIPIQPSFNSVVMVSPKAVIKRPKSSKIDLKSIIKSDQFFSFYNEKIDETKVSDVVGILKICASETIKILGEKLVALHQPGRIDYIKKFDLTDILLKKVSVLPHSSSQQSYSTQNSAVLEDKVADANICAKCGNLLVLRTAKSGINAGSQFYGCSTFPSCRHTEKLEPTVGKEFLV